MNKIQKENFWFFIASSYKTIFTSSNWLYNKAIFINKHYVQSSNPDVFFSRKKSMRSYQSLTTVNINFPLIKHVNLPSQISLLVLIVILPLLVMMCPSICVHIKVSQKQSYITTRLHSLFVIIYPYIPAGIISVLSSKWILPIYFIFVWLWTSMWALLLLCWT